MTDNQHSESLDTTAAAEPIPVGGSIEMTPGSIVLDRFEVIGLLGKGGMGSVYHVKHLHLKSEFALKVLNKQADSSVWRRFDNEAKAASRLDHPNLIRVQDSGLLPDGQPFFIMDLVKGETLSDMIKRSGRIPLKETLKIFIQVGFALAYAHDNGIVHRDLKPSNIMIAKTQERSLVGTVKVLDLGIAKLTGIDDFNQQTLTRTGEIFGSPLYMSPEQCMGIAVDNRSDLYSFGCSMYEALTGAPPVIGENALSTMMRHQSDKPLSLKEASLGLDFPQQVETLIATLLEKDPTNRYANAHMLTHDLVQLEQRLSEQVIDNSSNALNIEKATQAEHYQRSKNSLVEFTTIAILLLGAYLLGLATSLVVERPSKPKVVEKVSNVPQNVIAKPKREEYETPSQPDQKNPISQISPDGKTRIFKFGHRPVGVITVNWLGARHAIGDISVPINAPVHFAPDPHYLTSPVFLSRFGPDDLTSLALDDMVQTDPSALSALPKLKGLVSLKLAMDVGDEVLPYLDKLEKLENLDVAHTHLSGEAFARLKRLPYIKSLDASHMLPIRPVLERLTAESMSDLRIDDVQLTVDEMRYLTKFKDLRHLSIGGNRCVNDETLALLTPLKNLFYLSIVSCKVTDKSIPTIKSFQSLKEIKTSDWTPAQIEKFRRLIKRIKIYVIAKLHIEESETARPAKH